jgi:hypothetical protein
MFNFFRRKPEPETIVPPLMWVEHCIDQLNEAMRELRKEDEFRHLRPWVRPGDARTRQAAKVMLGYWDTEGGRFVTVYGED